MKSYRLLVLVISALLLFQVVGANSLYVTPEATLDTYLSACKDADFARADACYTKSSRALLYRNLEGRPPRDPSLLKQTYSRMSALNFVTERVNSKRAILWPNDKSVPPFFLRIQDSEEEWRIDYHFMSNYINVKEDGWSWKHPKIFKLWKSRS